MLPGTAPFPDPHEEDTDSSDLSSDESSDEATRHETQQQSVAGTPLQDGEPRPHAATGGGPFGRRSSTATPETDGGSISGSSDAGRSSLRHDDVRDRVPEEAFTGHAARELSVTKVEWKHLIGEIKELKHRSRRQVTEDTMKHMSRFLPVNHTSVDEEDGRHAPNPKNRWKHRSVFGCKLWRPDTWFPLFEAFIVLLMDATYIAFVVPIEIAFLIPLNKWNWATILDLIAGVLIFVDILVNFQTGMVVRHKLDKRVIKDGRQVALLYIRKGSFVIDVLSAIPSVVEFILLLAIPHKNVKGYLGIVALLRFLRLLRMGRVASRLFFTAMGGGKLTRRTIGWLSPQIVYFASILYATAFLLNFLGMVWYFTARVEGLHDSWLATIGNNGNGLDFSVKPAFDRYVASVFFVVTTITTIGFGDIVPVNTGEMIVAMFIMLAGTVFFGFLIGTLGDVMERASIHARRATHFRNKIESVDTWMRTQNLPQRMRRQITKYYAEVWVRATEAQTTSFFEELPAKLRAEVVGHLMHDVLANSEVFKAMGDSVVRQLASRLRPVVVAPGHDICQQGDDADCLWIVQEGQVLMLRHTKEVEVVLPPAILGEAAILQDHIPEAATRECTYRAIGGVMLWELKIKALQPIAEFHPQLWDHITSNLKRKLTRCHKRFPSDVRWTRLLKGLEASQQSKEEAAQAAHDDHTKIHESISELQEGGDLADGKQKEEHEGHEKNATAGDGPGADEAETSGSGSGGSSAGRAGAARQQRYQANADVRDTLESIDVEASTRNVKAVESKPSTGYASDQK